jgi:flagellar biosynthesis anti-sigma factor FlgM
MSLLDGIGGMKGSLERSAAMSAPRTRDKAVEDKSATKTTKNSEDATTFSTASELLTKALDGSDVRSEKIDALKQSITNGTYSVPSIEVAGKIVDALSS